MKKETIELMVIFAALIGFILLANWNRIRKPKNEGLGNLKFEILEISHGHVLLRSDAGSMIDHGLREDMDVLGAGHQELISHDENGMVFRVTVKDGEDPQRVAKRLKARHSMRVNPTNDWSGREDFRTLLEDWDG
jgi:hypothetical protein